MAGEKGATQQVLYGQQDVPVVPRLQPSWAALTSHGGRGRSLVPEVVPVTDTPLSAQVLVPE